ncbi:Uncharacterised protein [Kocuria rosea]|nr:Uncharacterised protein [Kocuria rosea]
MVRLHNTAGQDRATRFQVLPHGFQAELVQTDERSQVGTGGDSVKHVEVFRMGGVGTLIIGKPQPSSND